VHWAADAAEGQAIVLDIAKRGVRHVIKSMATEEISKPPRGGTDRWWRPIGGIIANSTTASAVIADLF
jgi:hypothetical protein